MCRLSSISTTSCFYVHKKVLGMAEHLSNMYNCTYVCLFVLGLEYNSYYCPTVAVTKDFQAALGLPEKLESL